MAGLGGLAVLGLGLAVAIGLGGCADLRYLAQSVGGHLDVVHRARPVAEVQTDPQTPPDLAARLALSQRMRDFAVQELRLPDNASYRRYSELSRPAVVWNVVAAPPLSLTLKTWCFPVMGCVGYRGYYDRAQADALAATLQREGWEVSVYGVPAYSTLGWSNWLGGDPLLSTFIRWSDGELARLLFHELAHQVVYVSDDTMFNESFATAVERLGSALWLARYTDPAQREAQAAVELRRRDFKALTLQTRRQLAALYAGPGSDEDKRREKAQLMARMREAYAQVKATRWGGFSGYDGWMASANNASLGVQAAYDELVPDFERLFEREQRSFERFYAAVRQLAALPRDERRRQLATPP